ncbi:MAG TPA: PD-(D/E)XK nuclease family protein [Spirochaetota bacterium]|nr:PD-(D/E)XK nuclease family protein [Spirochaetota bacterium]
MSDKLNTLANLPKDYISVSQLNCYNNCSEQYNRRYVLKEKVSNLTKIDGLLIGSAFHKFIEEYFSEVLIANYEKHFFNTLFENINQGKLEIIDKEAKDFVVAKFLDYKMRNYIVYDEIIDNLEKVLTLDDYQTFLIGYKERPSLLKIFNNLTLFFLQNKSNILKDVVFNDTEQDFSYTFERYGKSFVLNGILDFTGVYQDKPIIIDWKTGKRAWNINDVTKKQDIIYSYMFWKRKGVIPLFRYVIFSYSDKTGEVKHQIFDIQYTEKQLLEVERIIHSIARGINEKVFFKNEGGWMCSQDYCEYYKSCQEYKNGIDVKEILT